MSGKVVSSAPVTTAMDKCGVDWPGVSDTINHVIHLLETQGTTVVRIVRTTMAGIAALTGRDMIGVFAAIQSDTADVKMIIAAIKAEFGLE